jgi:hypothetical protein
MKLSVRKIDERIQKLQEIKRIAADPELVAMLLEFVASEDDHPDTGSSAMVQAGSAPKPGDIEIVNQVMRGVVPQNNAASSARRP